MNSAEILLAAMEPLPQWLNFLVMVFAILLAAAGALVWLVVFRKKGKRKRRRRHQREKRQLNPTLAESGGLPPIHGEKETDTPPP
jgi:hypothetical protein